MKKTLLIAAAITILLSISCSKDGSDGGNTPDCSSVPKSFSANVNPIVQSTCNAAGCHASGSFNGPGAITNYNEVFTNRVIIRSVIASGRMPQGGSLSTAKKFYSLLD